MLKLENIEKRYAEFSLKNISFKISKGEILSLIGPSGSGKSTIIKIITGIIKPDAGNLFFGETNITGYPPEMRNFGYIPQTIGLFSHLNVRRNIEFPLRFRKQGKKDMEKRVLSIMNDFGIKEFSNRYSNNLSGGEKQKVALARAFVFNPHIILMDEPMNSIDYQMREKYLKFVKQISKRYGTPIIYVTHNFEEAIAISDRIIVIKEGDIIKQGFINDYINNPDDVWIASFFRHKNIIFGYLKDREFSVENSDLIIKTTLEGEGETSIMIKGDEIILSKEKIFSSALNCFEGKIKDFKPELYNREITIDVRGVMFKVIITEESFKKLSLDYNSEVYLSFKANSIKKLKG
jgi:molybdopterin-binding protein